MQILDLLFPKNCLECKKSGTYICSSCLQKVETSKLICPICRKHNFQGKTHSFCINKHSLAGMYSFYKYEGVVRKAILRLKYNFASDVAGELTDSIYFRLRNENLSFKDALLIPVPLHKAREKWRGFNQAAMLGKMLAEKQGWEFNGNLLFKLENTIPQVKLGKKERLQNIYGKFAVKEEEIKRLSKKDIKIIVFDDVWTTGATINEAGRALKKAGASEVWGMSVARS